MGTSSTDPNALWPQTLSLATLALNNTKTVYGFSPTEIFYGNTKKPNNLIENDTKTNSLEQYMTLVQNNFDATIQKIFLARQKSSQERADLVNRHRKSKNFEIGQLVWLKGIASATSPHRALKVQNLGPFKILQKSNDHTFFLARLSNPTKCDRIAHATHLEPYKCRVDMTPINFPSIAWNLN